MRKTKVHKGLNLLYFTAVLILFWSCKSNKVVNEEAKAKDLVVLETLLAQSNYHIDIVVAYPFSSVATTQVLITLLRNTGNTANRIDLRGNGDFIEIQNDSIKGYLSFFGERRLNAGGYGSSNSAIQIEEPLKDLTKNIDEDKVKLELEFSANQKGADNEKYDIQLQIYPNKNVSVNITPVYKTFMRYDGILKSDENQKE